MAVNDTQATGMPHPQELARLSPQELAQAMEQALDEMTEDTYDQAVLDAYLDALDAQAPMPEMPDPDASYQQFQAMLSGAVSPQEEPKPRRRGKVLGMTLRVFLAAAFLVGCMVAAQASGMNLLGSVIRWTDDTFLVELSTTPPTFPWYQKHLNKLAKVDLTTRDLPAWLPEGYKEPPMVSISIGNGPFTSAFFNLEGPNGAWIGLSIMTNLDMDGMEYLSIAKDDAPVELYEINDKRVYFFSDGNGAKAVCQYGDVFYLLEGDVTEDMVEPFFGSIGQAP